MRSSLHITAAYREGSLVLVRGLASLPPRLLLPLQRPEVVGLAAPLCLTLTLTLILTLNLPLALTPTLTLSLILKMGDSTLHSVSVVAVVSVRVSRMRTFSGSTKNR